VKNNELELISYNQFHSDHKLQIKRKEITPEMKEEIKNFHKRSQVNEIQAYLESKFKTELNYKTVYSEFRKIFPLLSSQDATKFVEFFSQNGYKCIKDINEAEQKYTKILIVSKLMMETYKEYGDIIILDATYRTNKYSLHTSNFSGFNYAGRNCLLGIAIVNDETEGTYEWVLQNFFQFHSNKYPRIIVTDQDASISAVITKKYSNSIKYYFHCSWHIKQNLKKNCSYLASLKMSDLRDRIVNLPYLQKRKYSIKKFQKY